MTAEEVFEELVGRYEELRRSVAEESGIRDWNAFVRRLDAEIRDLRERFFTGLEQEGW